MADSEAAVSGGNSSVPGSSLGAIGHDGWDEGLGAKFSYIADAVGGPKGSGCAGLIPYAHAVARRITAAGTHGVDAFWSKVVLGAAATVFGERLPTMFT